MKLDRNERDDGRGKYAVINLRKLGGFSPEKLQEIEAALSLLSDLGLLEYGPVGSDQEFFVMKLRDRFSRQGLWAYSEAAKSHDAEYADEIMQMALRAGIAHPHWKYPD